jgi:hypothetical protein
MPSRCMLLAYPRLLISVFWGGAYSVITPIHHKRTSIMQIICQLGNTIGFGLSCIEIYTYIYICTFGRMGSIKFVFVPDVVKRNQVG